jgi:hypothetical protein
MTPAGLSAVGTKLEMILGIQSPSKQRTLVQLPAHFTVCAAWSMLYKFFLLLPAASDVDSS